MHDNWNLLVVEDESDSANIVARILTFHKIRYSVVASGEEALNHMTNERPTGLIIDLALPGGMDGWELIRQIRRTPEMQPIRAVAVTAFHSTSVAHEAIRAGFDAYFPKPIEATSFVRGLEDVFGNEA